MGIAGFMKYVNAPTLNGACCVYHNTAIYFSMALGRLLSGPCKPVWMPISAEKLEVCGNCGMLVSRHNTCFFCTNLADFSDWASAKRVSKATSRPLLLKKELFTNVCMNLLRHIGTADFTTAIEYLIGVAVDLSMQPEWQEFWENNPPSEGWTCATCQGKSDEGMTTCCICRTPRMV